MEFCATNTLYNYSNSSHIKRHRNDTNVPRKYIKVRSFKNYDSKAMGKGLQAFNWGRFFATRDINTAWAILYMIRF